MMSVRGPGAGKGPSGFACRLGFPASKEERGAFLAGMGCMVAMCCAGAAVVVLSWAAMTSDGLRASLLELIYAGGAGAFVIGGVLFWKTRPAPGGARGAWSRAFGAWLGSIAAAMVFLTGAFLAVLGLCVSQVVLAPGPLEAPPAEVAVRLGWNVLWALLAVVAAGAICGSTMVLGRRHRQAATGSGGE